MLPTMLPTTQSISKEKKGSSTSNDTTTNRTFGTHRNFLVVVLLLGLVTYSLISNSSSMLAYISESQSVPNTLSPTILFSGIHTHELVLKREESSGTSWESLPVLSSKGVSLKIPDFSHTVKHGNLNIVADEHIKHVPRADGDEAMQYILDKIDIVSRCQDNPSLIVIDVGGLFGDFGLSSAERGCRTIIYEPQIHHAQQIARSVLINQLQEKAKVHQAAVSPKEWVSFAIGKEGTASVKEASTTADNKIPAEQLDKEFKDHLILLLKVDVEGNEDEVWATAAKLFQQNQILHAIFEYTPKQFEGRGTDYATFLSRLYKAGAKQCYALHRKKKRIFLIPEEQSDVFHKQMFAQSLQTDIYCSFRNNEPSVFEDAPVWSETSNLLGK
jgi:FkbM family methyltransferase